MPSSQRTNASGCAGVHPGRGGGGGAGSDVGHRSAVLSARSRVLSARAPIGEADTTATTGSPAAAAAVAAEAQDEQTL
jgi:hypothetical protein